MSRWVVLRSSKFADRDHRPYWESVINNAGVKWENVWEAADATEAFQKAVVENYREQVTSGSYRILPFDGGMTINVTIDIEKEPH
jgi:hypothetical protein